ncbi:hypothetical protein MLD38_007877 [Melastoma candidum]|uniref:Uncharacterized protein n=1 Tax=Melastoma candidum TaxID=119954 RepID=A0ACB9RVJ7_9MYRT|nr:hypothetical protein MLD38_007877 [Melastoma candidum]
MKTEEDRKLIEFARLLISDEALSENFLEMCWGVGGGEREGERGRPHNFSSHLISSSLPVALPTRVQSLFCFFSWEGVGVVDKVPGVPLIEMF